MNTKLISRASISTVLSIAIALNSFAQKAIEKNEPAAETYSHEIAIDFPSVGSEISSNAEISSYNRMQLENLNEEPLFQPNAKWEQLGDKFLVTFPTGETLTRALFDKTGKMIYSINYCSEKQLPQDVIRLAMNNYENYKITSAAKVLEGNRQTWLLNLEGENNFIAIRLEGSEITEVENFRKAK